VANEAAVAGAATPNVMSMRMAELRTWLDARGTDLRLIAPPSHAKFISMQADEVADTSVVSGDLVLRVRCEPLPAAATRRTALCLTKIWELWMDEAGRYIFVAPRQLPPRRAVVAPDFTAGEVLGDFSSGDPKGIYPLQGLDNVLYANWLAGFGDVILHASGVAVDEKGYCFIGPSGVGKSTLAAHLSATHSATVLGEDQVIIRYLQNRFWIYGAPWHLNPQMCSPRGVPLERLFFLERSDRHDVVPLAPVDGIARLMQTAFIPYYNRAGVAAILNHLEALAEQVPFNTLSYRLGSDVWKLIKGP
jgi:hypothetical protein